MDPLFPSPDLTSNKKLLVNELPHEIKYSLIFDEDIDGEEIKEIHKAYNKNNKRNIYHHDSDKASDI